MCIRIFKHWQNERLNNLQKENFMNILGNIGIVGCCMTLLLLLVAVTLNLVYMKWPNLEFKVQMWIKRHERIAEPVFIIYILCCIYGVIWKVVLNR